MTAALASLVRRAWHRAEPAGSHYKNVLLSFPKSGRTWLAYLYAYYAGYVVAGDQAEAFLDKTFSKRCDIYRPLENPALVALVDADPTRRIDLVTTLHHFPAVPYFQLDVP